MPPAGGGPRHGAGQGRRAPRPTARRPADLKGPARRPRIRPREPSSATILPSPHAARNRAGATSLLVLALLRAQLGVGEKQEGSLHPLADAAGVLGEREPELEEDRVDVLLDGALRE